MELTTEIIKSKIPRMSSEKSNGDAEEITKNNSKVDNGVSNNNNNSKTGIWALHRYCSQNKIKPPWYKITETTDFDNRKLFTVECHIKQKSDLYETACCTKKKEAKHKASYLLLNRLQSSEHTEITNDANENSFEEGEIDDFEEGEIDDFEEGEIKDGGDINTSCNDVLMSLHDKYKYKFFKVYTEGNVNKSNCIINVQIEDTSAIELKKLAEFCFEQKLPSPRYEVKEHTGLVSPIFTCKCSVLQLVIRTSGSSMIQAKEKAAKLLLAKMKQHINILQSDFNDENKQTDLEEGEIIDNDSTNCKNNKRSKPQISRNEKKIKLDEDDQQLNTMRSRDMGMGDLYNFCLRMKIPPPVYAMIKKENFSATKTIFTFKCSVLKFSKLGKGLNKKQAKHRAAKTVLERLQNWNKVELNQENDEIELLEESQLTENDELIRKEYIKHKLENNFISYEQKNSLQLRFITERHSVIETDKPYSDSIIITKLKELDEDFLKRNAIVILKHLCKEIDCCYSFIDIKSLTICTVNLFITSTPPWSTFGRGNSLMEAKNDAAWKLLIFLKNMTN